MFNNAGILKYNTMDDKLMYEPKGDQQNYYSCWIKPFDEISGRST